MKQLIFSICLALLAASCSETGSWPEEKFSAENWSRTPEDGRFVLAKDLLDQHLLIGLTPEEVQKLLGKPSFESEKDGQISYIIKTGGAGFDKVFLLDVRIDVKSGKVAKAFIRGD